MNKLIQVHQDEIDLLAENELNRDERELLFARLDCDSTGWKRCAVALLEQRTLKVSFDSLSFGHSVPDKNGLAGPETKLRKGIPKGFHAKRIAGAAAAASVLLLCGFLFGSFLNQSSSKQIIANQDNVGTHETVPGADRVDPELVRQANLAMESTGVVEFELVAFVKIGDASQTRVYPLIRSAELSQKMNEMPKPKLPDKITQELQRSGWNLRTHQQFVSFDFPNGIRQTMPVGMLNYSYVGRETF